MTEFVPPIPTIMRIEPDSVAVDNPPQHPYNNIITHTAAGHSIECDDTPGQERIRIQHGGANGNSTGPFIEFTANSGVIKITGNTYQISLNDHTLDVGGQLNINVTGDCQLQVAGDMVQTVEGNYEQHIKGNWTTFVEGQIEHQSKMGMYLGGGNYFILSTAGTVFTDADLQVNGNMMADKISSFGRIDAGTGVSAGPLGFVTALGGISVGVPPGVTPVAVPGTINCFGYINSFTEVSAPLVMAGITDSVLCFDVVNRMIYNTHTHPAPDGVTGPPFQPEVGGV
jgi:hypothetical protein